MGSPGEGGGNSALELKHHVLNGRLAQAKRLLAATRLSLEDCQDEDGNTALHWCAQGLQADAEGRDAPDEETLVFLLQSEAMIGGHADPCRADISGETPLMEAAAAGLEGISKKQREKQAKKFEQTLFGQRLRPGLAADKDRPGKPYPEYGLKAGGGQSRASRTVSQLEAQPVAHEEAARDITSEVRLLRQLDHPNVVRYCDSFAAASSSGAAATLWIVMEYCRGVSLQAFASSARAKGLARLPEEQTERILVQLCLALKYLHVEKDIAHRDLTPNNVLVNSHTLAVKIVDFGWACFPPPPP
ncbi:unnamed protein product [Prorocentrum cordatum]|uniref:non-specific serine/threonine protein kinase n=1 Tax=Prorocentrum cordatum TaxID=2364126 RepID=A0ABN9UAH7_9DINO|nr:unnamed protein product [Polarella glacialis]